MIFLILWILIYHFFQDCKKSFILISENKFVYKEKKLIYFEYKKAKILGFFLLQNNICEYHNAPTNSKGYFELKKTLLNASFRYFW